MKVVQPESKTSLLLNKNYQAFAFCTARAAIRHFMTGRVLGLDAENNTHDFETWRQLRQIFLVQRTLSMLL